MKIYISADIEGCCGVTHWNEANITHAEYAPFRQQMTAEVKAACEGALAAGASEILVKDAHASGRNLIGSDFPREVSLIRGWSGSPLSMVQELDESFDAAFFIGYHARAGSEGNPLAHTMSGSTVAAMRINDRPTSEYLLHALAAATMAVPVVFLSGDEAICEEVQSVQPACKTFAVKGGQGASTINVHPDLALDGIRNACQEALSGNPKDALLSLPETFQLEIDYKTTQDAYKMAFYPGAEQTSPQTVGFASKEYYEILRAVHFLL